MWRSLEDFFVFFGGPELSNFVGELDGVLAYARENGAADIGGQFFGSENTGGIAREEFDELGGDVGGGVGHGGSEQSLLANLIERGKHGVAADEQVFVFLGTVVHATNQHGSGKPGILQNAATNERSDFARRGRFRKTLPLKSARLGKLALSMPTAEAVELIAADLHIEILHRNEFG